MKNISTWYWDAKESSNQGGNFLNFQGFSWSHAGPKSKLHSRTEISSMASLTPKSSIGNKELLLKFETFILCLNSRVSTYFIPGYFKAVYQKLFAKFSNYLLHIKQLLLTQGQAKLFSQDVVVPSNKFILNCLL